MKQFKVYFLMTAGDQQRSGEKQLDLSLLRRRYCETLSGRGRRDGGRGAGGLMRVGESAARRVQRGRCGWGRRLMAG